MVATDYHKPFLSKYFLLLVDSSERPSKCLMSLNYRREENIVVKRASLYSARLACGKHKNKCSSRELKGGSLLRKFKVALKATQFAVMKMNLRSVRDVNSRKWEKLSFPLEWKSMTDLNSSLRLCLYEKRLLPFDPWELVCRCVWRSFVWKWKL